MDCPLDFLGHPILVGCNLVYPVRRGSRMWMNKLTVTKVETDAVYGYCPDTNRPVKLTNLNNTTIVSAPK